MISFSTTTLGAASHPHMIAIRRARRARLMRIASRYEAPTRRVISAVIGAALMLLILAALKHFF